MLTVCTAFKFALLFCNLACKPFKGIVQKLCKALRFYPHSVTAVTSLIESVKQIGETLLAFNLCKVAVLLNIHKAEVHGLAVLTINHNRLARTVGTNAFQLFNFICKSVKKHTFNSVGCALHNLIFNLTADNRRNTLNCPQKCLVKRHFRVEIFHGSTHIKCRTFKQIQLVLRFGKFVFYIRQYKSFTAHCEVNTLERVDDNTV